MSPLYTFVPKPRLTDFSFGIFYNAMPGQDRKDLIEEWGRGMYPEAWEELEKVGRYTVDDGFVTLFKIKQKWEA